MLVFRCPALPSPTMPFSPKNKIKIYYIIMNNITDSKKLLKELKKIYKPHKKFIKKYTNNKLIDYINKVYNMLNGPRYDKGFKRDCRIQKKILLKFLMNNGNKDDFINKFNEILYDEVKTIEDNKKIFILEETSESDNDTDVFINEKNKDKYDIILVSFETFSNSETTLET